MLQLLDVAGTTDVTFDAAIAITISSLLRRSYGLWPLMTDAVVAAVAAAAVALCGRDAGH